MPSSAIKKSLSDGMALIRIAFSCYLLLALFTYNPHDSSWSQLSSSEITNKGGMIGAYLADISYFFFGYVAFLLPLLLTIGMLRGSEESLASARGLSIASRLFAIILLLLGGCGTVYYSWPATTSLGFTLPAGSGGIVGGIVLTALQIFGVYGTPLLLAVSLLLGITLYFHLSWHAICEALGEIIWRCIVSSWVAINLCARWLSQIAVTIWRWCTCYTSHRQTQATMQEPMIVTQDQRLIEPTIDDLHSTELRQDNTNKKGNTTKPEEEGLAPTEIKTVTMGQTLMPSANLLNHPTQPTNKNNELQLQQLGDAIKTKLAEFRIQVDVVSIQPGPVVNLFEIQPKPGTKASSITRISNDIARALAVPNVRVVEVIPGKSVMAIEIPNQTRQTVYLKEIIESTHFYHSTSRLMLAIGKDIAGNAVSSDLATMPHLLLAGTTGSGKSVAINAIILSLLYKATPEEVRLLLIDPKVLELSMYEDIPHLLTPVITDMQKAANSLRWCVDEMERRYRLMSALSVRNMHAYNEKIKDSYDTKTLNTDSQQALKPLPAIVIIIDEFADMMMTIGKEVETMITRIAQKARAAGIHLILATQRPDANVITGLIKSNIPTRIAFKVSTALDSRIIIDQGGAEQLIGYGDMLIKTVATATAQRLHGAFVSDDEVLRVVEDWKQKATPNYTLAVTEQSKMNNSPEPPPQDNLFEQAVTFVQETKKTSISALQRHFRIGYNRAATLIEDMERKGILSEPSSNGAREIINHGEDL